jgi:high-affinity iron transporter
VTPRRSLLLAAALLVLGVSSAHAASTPGQAATQVRERLGNAGQALILGSEGEAATTVALAQREYRADLRGPLAAAPAERAALESALARAHAAAAAGDETGLAVASSEAWAALAGGGYRLALAATERGDAATAARWLLVREFRPPTKLSRPGANATLANVQLAQGTLSPARAAAALRADLLDTYQSRLRDALGSVAPSLANDLPVSAAQQAALAEGFWGVLAPSYRRQVGAAAETSVARDLAALTSAARAGRKAEVATLAGALSQRLDAFRAAPLSAAEQRRRASQVRTFTPLVAVEYGRGVDDGRVLRDFEIQEAITFQTGALSAFRDIEPMLLKRDAGSARTVARSLEQLGGDLDAASSGTRVLDPKLFEQRTKAIVAATDTLFPKPWLAHDSSADFDLIAGSLERMQKAVEAGQYHIAEQARIEAYAFFELGPEQRLRGLAPELFARSEGLFWYGSGDSDGLATLINGRGSPSEIAANRVALDRALSEAEEAVGTGPKSRTTVITNTAIIVFREGLEAVLILAALMASFKGGQRRLRRPMWLGVGAALLASAATWVVAQTILTSLTRYGERLSAVVGLIAIGMLLVILNWFFHKTYWTGHLAGLHGRKQAMLTSGGIAFAQLAALATLGFTSVYREGFETVLFVQALVLATDVATVLTGVLVGVAATVLVGFAVFSLERKLPQKKMLMLTGAMVTWVLVVMVGTTVQIMQTVGWIAVTPISGLRTPYWSGLWFGLYPTWEGVLLQLAAFLFVIGSYVAAEALRKRRRNRAFARGTVLGAEPLRERVL